TLELAPQASDELLRSLLAQCEPLARAADAVESRRRLLPAPGRVRELLFRRRALLEQPLEPLVRRPPCQRGRRAALLDAGEPLVEDGEVELGDACPQRRDLAAELLRPLGRRRLQRERPQPLPDLVLD